MAGEEELVVTIEPELPMGDAADAKANADATADKTAKAADDKAKDKNADPVAALTEQYAALKAREDQNEAARKAAEQRAAQATRDAIAARQEAATAKTEIAESQLDTITTGISAAQSESTAAEGEYRVAMEAADWGAAAKAQRKMAAAEAHRVRLEEAKDEIEARRGEDPKKPKPEAPASTDPLEDYVAKLSPASAQWVRNHPEWVSDPKKNARLTAGHWQAISEGLAADTPEYFERIETYIELRKPDGGNGAIPPKPAAKKGQAPVAPVSPSGGGTGGNGVEVRLTPREAAAAADGTHIWNYDDPSPQKRFKKGDPIGVQEFARRKKKMMDDGVYDRTYTDS